MKPKPLTNEQVYSFTMSLSHLLHGGIGAADALLLLKEDETDRDLRQLLAVLSQDMDAGKALSTALRDSRRFPGYVCALLEVGERTGRPQQVLESLACYYQDRTRMTRQLRSALLYPVLLLAVLLAVVALLLIYVLPVFDSVYAQLGSGLTGFPGSLLALGQTLQALLPWFAGFLAVCGGVIAFPASRNFCLRLGQRLLGDRGVFRRIYTARFIQALWLCICSGMSASEGIGLAASLAETPGLQKRCGTCLEHAEAGASLSAALREAQLLQPSHCRLLEAGERSGRSEQVLEDLSRNLLEAGEEDLVRVAGMTEPVLVTLCSVLIGAILLSVLLPLLHIMSAL